MAVLGYAGRLIMLQPFATLEPAENVPHLVGTIGGKQDGDRLTYYFLAGIAVHVLSRTIPTGDDPLQGLAEDGIIRPLYNGREQRLRSTAFRIAGHRRWQAARRFRRRLSPRQQSLNFHQQFFWTFGLAQENVGMFEPFRHITGSRQNDDRNLRLDTPNSVGLF